MLVGEGPHRDVEPCPLDQRLRPDRLAGRDVLLHYPPENLPLAKRQVQLHAHLQDILREKRSRDRAAEG